MTRIRAGSRRILVSREDAPLVRGFRWYVRRASTSKTWYAYARVSGRRTQMANLLLPPITGRTVDHANGNGLDNRRENLRYATRREQQRNQGPRVGTSRYKGVSFCKRTGRWRASITIDWRTRNVGRYDTEEQAARAYDAAAAVLHGEFARLNLGPPPLSTVEAMRQRLARVRVAQKIAREDYRRIAADPRPPSEVAKQYQVTPGRIRAIRRQISRGRRSSRGV